MQVPAHPSNEAERLAALRHLNILDTDAEERFDRYTRLAKHAFDVPIALVSLVDSGRQWFKSRQGLDATETPREISFCGHAILKDELFVVENAKHDERFSDNPLVTDDPNIRFYAGYPLQCPGGYRIGTLCIIDTTPRDFSEQDRTVLADIGSMVAQEFATTQLALTDELTSISNRRGFELLADQALALCRRAHQPAAAIMIDMDGFKEINDTLGHHTGDEALRAFAGLLLATFRDSDVVARTGGDEFCVLLTGSTAVDTNATIDRLQDAVDAYNAQSLPYRLAFSAGIAELAPDCEGTLESIMRTADAEMYARKRAKRSGPESRTAGAQS